MEEILGISQDFTWERRTAVDMLGEDATEADMQMDADEHNRARERYQRLFWEPVVEGQVCFDVLSPIAMFSLITFLFRNQSSLRS